MSRHVRYLFQNASLGSEELSWVSVLHPPQDSALIWLVLAFASWVLGLCTACCNEVREGRPTTPICNACAFLLLQSYPAALLHPVFGGFLDMVEGRTPVPITKADATLVWQLAADMQKVYPDEAARMREIHPHLQNLFQDLDYRQDPGSALSPKGEADALIFCDIPGIGEQMVAVLEAKVSRLISWPVSTKMPRLSGCVENFGYLACVSVILMI